MFTERRSHTDLMIIRVCLVVADKGVRLFCVVSRVTEGNGCPEADCPWSMMVIFDDNGSL